MGGLGVASGSSVAVGPGVAEFKGMTVKVGTLVAVEVFAGVAVDGMAVGAAVVTSGASGVVTLP